MLKKIMKTVTIAALGTMIALPALADSILDKSWADIEAQAKQEGEVVWYNWFLKPQFREHVKIFEDKYGIKVTIPEGEHDGTLQKMLAESKREVGDIDVISFGGSKINNFEFKDLLIGPIQSVMPEGDALKTKIEGGDGQGYTVAFWGNQTGVAYDSNRVKEEDLPQTFDELNAWMAANPQSLGFNFEKGGSGPSFIQNITRNILNAPITGLEDNAPDFTPAFTWFNDNKDKYVITASNADSLIRLNDGEFLITPAWEDHLGSLRGKNEVGQHILFYIPGWGMNGGGNVVGIPKNAKNKAASLLFISWLTSAENQTSFNVKFGTAPTNANADDSKALASNDQRLNQKSWMLDARGKEFMDAFIENVIED